MTEKIFIGYTKGVKTKFGEIITISFGDEDRKKLEQYSNEAGYTTIKIMDSRKGSKYAEIDTWSLNKLDTEVKPDTFEEDEINLDEIPF
jgi:hypothetical protein